MQTQDATNIRTRFGPPDVALLPYSGASIYPWVFRNYSHEDKLARADRVRFSRLEKFCQLAEAIGSTNVVPAAGSFVYGGCIAVQSQYQLQATPTQIVTFMANRPLNATLHLMATGDVLDCQTGRSTLSQDASFRNFSDIDRMTYAATLQEFRCPVDEIIWPTDLPIPWRTLIRRARANIWKRQLELGVFPECRVELIIRNDRGLASSTNEQSVQFFLDRNEIANGASSSTRPYVRFYLTAGLLLAVLTGAVFWNVAEYLMEIERDPDEFHVAAHRLMAYLRI